MNVEDYPCDCLKETTFSPKQTEAFRKGYYTSAMTKSEICYRCKILETRAVAQNYRFQATESLRHAEKLETEVIPRMIRSLTPVGRAEIELEEAEAAYKAALDKVAKLKRPLDETQSETSTAKESKHEAIPPAADSSAIQTDD